MTDELYEAGLAVRRKVLGGEYVDRALASAKGDAFLEPLQDLVTTVGWGAIWGRPGLSHKSRSMITVAMLVARNRLHEVAIHLRGAINNGCTEEEIREILLHAGCYCGWPAAIDAFRVAKKVLAEMGPPPEDKTEEPT